MRGTSSSRSSTLAAYALLGACAAISFPARAAPPPLPATPPGPPLDIVAHARPALRVFTDKDGLPQNTVAAETFDSDGRLWVGTQEGLAFYDGRAFHRVPLRTEPSPSARTPAGSGS